MIVKTTEMLFKQIPCKIIGKFPVGKNIGNSLEGGTLREYQKQQFQA